MAKTSKKASKPARNMAKTGKRASKPASSMAKASTSASNPSGAEVFLEVLRNYGVEYIFSSPGSEWPPLWEALAKQKAEGLKGPAYINTRHEDLAIGMAMGYGRATGKLSACVVHANVGTLHAAMGIRAANHEKIPVLVCAGESVTFGEGPDGWVGSQWGRFLADYGGPAALVEKFTKTSFGLNTPAVLASAVHRACRTAMTAPQGVAFLSLPFEYLMHEAVLPAPKQDGMPVPALIDGTALEKVAAMLVKAAKPLIITENLGARTKTVAQLVQLAEATGAQVVEAQQPGYVNFPRNHALHAGYISAPHLQDADLVLLLDCEGPWYPPRAGHPPKAQVVNISDDPNRDRVPYTGFNADINIVGSGVSAVPILLEKVLAAPGLKKAKAKVKARIKEVKAVNDARRAEWRKNGLANKATSPIDARWFSLQLNDMLPDNAIVVDETLTSHFTVIHCMDDIKPGQLVNGLSGGLGLGMGIALGVKIANPDKLVITLVGDGSFNYNPPLAALGCAQEHNLPTLTIIYNNGQYRSMKMGTQMLYPKGAAAQTDTWYGGPIQPVPEYAGLARLFGGYGETVEDPAEIAGALQRAFDAVNSGKSAMLDVRIGDEIPFLAKMFGGS